MAQLKLCVLVLVLAAAIGGSVAVSRGEWAAKKSAMANDIMKRVQKRTNGAEQDSTLVCYSCKSSDNTNSCEADIELCRVGEVCASVWHADNTNFDGCMASTLCTMLESSSANFAQCCNTELCNMLQW